MKKIIAVFCLLVLCFGLCACRQNSSEEKTPEENFLAEAELYIYDGYMEKLSEKAEFTLEGEFPAKKQKSGDFSGRIRVEEADGTEHIYENLQFCWAEDMLILHRVGPADGEDKDLLCWIDPENPEKVVLADQNWNKIVAVKEIVAYVDDTYTDAEARSIGTVINQIPDVFKTQFVHREDALKYFADAFDGMDASMLRHRYVITLDTENAETVMAQIKEVPGIADAQYSLRMENVRILGYKKNAEQMEQLLESCWNSLKTIKE